MTGERAEIDKAIAAWNVYTQRSIWKAAERTVAGLWRAIGSIIDTFTPMECASYFAAVG